MNLRSNLQQMSANLGMSQGLNNENAANEYSESQDLSIVSGSEEEQVMTLAENADDVDPEEGFEFIEEVLANLQQDIQ